MVEAWRVKVITMLPISKNSSWKVIHLQKQISHEKKKTTDWLENAGIDPAAYRMQSDRSTIWANSPSGMSCTTNRSNPINSPMCWSIFYSSRSTSSASSDFSNFKISLDIKGWSPSGLFMYRKSSWTPSWSDNAIMGRSMNGIWWKDIASLRMSLQQMAAVSIVIWKCPIFLVATPVFLKMLVLSASNSSTIGWKVRRMYKQYHFPRSLLWWNSQICWCHWERANSWLRYPEGLNAQRVKILMPFEVQCLDHVVWEPLDRSWLLTPAHFLWYLQQICILKHFPWTMDDTFQAPLRHLILDIFKNNNHQG